MRKTTTKQLLNHYFVSGGFFSVDIYYLHIHLNNIKTLSPGTCILGDHEKNKKKSLTKIKQTNK